jgi:hypothetical protein
MVMTRNTLEKSGELRKVLGLRRDKEKDDITVYVKDN